MGIGTLWRRSRRRFRYHARHSDTFFHPVVNYTVVALLVIATAAFVGYAMTVR